MTCKVTKNKYGIAFVCCRNREAPTEEDKRKIDKFLTEFLKKSAEYAKGKKKMKNDRLKFRVYSQDEKRYITDELVYLTQDGELLDSSNDVIENVIIERCTGLRDKNGKLIYEGDIIKTEDGNGVVYFRKDACFAVRNDNYIVAGTDICPFDNSVSFFLRNKKVFEIVGDIHQNQELLK